MRLHRSLTGEESPDNAGHRTSRKEGMFYMTESAAEIYTADGASSRHTGKGEKVR